MQVKAYVQLLLTYGGDCVAIASTMALGAFLSLSLCLSKSLWWTSQAEPHTRSFLP